MTNKIRQVKKCSVLWCPNAHYAKGLCTKHYANWRRSQMIVPSDDARMLMALSMNLLKSNVPTIDWATAIKDNWFEASESDVPKLADEFEKLVVVDKDGDDYD